MEDTVNTVNSNKSELWNLSLRDLFYKYVRFLPLIILSVAFALLIAWLYLRYTVPIYSVGGSLLIRSEQPGGGGRGGEVEALLSGNKVDNIPNEIEILKSSPLMKRVVDSLNLQFTYEAKGKIKTVNVYNQGGFIIQALEVADSNRNFAMKIKFQEEGKFRINSETKSFAFGQVFKNDKGVFRLIRNSSIPLTKEYSVSWMPTQTAANAYAGAIEVRPKTPGSGILLIGMRTKNAQMGADIINKLMEEYAVYSIEQKDKTSVQKLDFIDNRLAYYRHVIDSAQGVLIKFEKENNLIDSKAQSERYMNVITESDKVLNEQTYRLGVANLLSDYLRSQDNRYEKVPSSFDLQDITLAQFVTEYNKAQIARQQLLDANIPVNNPVVKEAGDQIEKLRTSIQENLKNIRSSLTSSLSSTRGRSNKYEGSLQALPQVVKEQLEMIRVIEGLQELNKLLLTEKERQAILKSATVSNSEVVNRAYPGTVPVRPNKKAIRILAVLFGLGLPVLIIFIAEVLNDKVGTRFDVERLTTAPILGEIGHSYSDKVLVVNKTTRSMVAEQFRIIRSNLQYILNKSQSTILVTSSFSGEGKSYISTNMGAVLALAGKRTIILEFDIRKPKILSGMNLSKGAGITNFLIGKAELKDIIQKVPDQDNLYVLGCGPIPPNPSELLLGEKVTEMFTWLKANFDVVLVDTAPVGMVSDAMTLGKFADSTLYLVRQGHTFKKQIALIDEFYKEGKLPKLSIIINDVKMQAGYGYYGYGRYGYGYGYGYGSYYEEETPPHNFIERALAWLDITRFFKKSKKN